MITEQGFNSFILHVHVVRQHHGENNRYRTNLTVRQTPAYSGLLGLTVAFWGVRRFYIT